MRKQGNYDVGYGKPPVHTRFKKGQSGNPKGFPRGGEKLAYALRRLLAMPLDDFDRYRPRTGAEEIAKQLIIIACEEDSPACVRAAKFIADRTEGKVR
ncbi:MAG TPA: DUF5681 domain-containing protein [Blastocatellia bacterium]|nr:DUF5681 domain-containing protein [Blastocatellia bacterium]